MAVTMRPATATDLPGVVACVEAAFGKYVARIDKPPSPMLADYAALIAADRVRVLTDAGGVAGVLVLEADTRRLFVEVMAVRPERQRRGFGQRLMECAEAIARGKGLDKIELYTHERMIEALSFYRGLGYVETGRRVEDGYARGYLRKTIGA
jgi:ribosomal protein S18 acetylase RimI-like enzyme